jgi:hypothetical protein
VAISQDEPLKMTLNMSRYQPPTLAFLFKADKLGTVHRPRHVNILRNIHTTSTPS